MTTECLALKRYQFCITISAIFAVYLFSNATTFAIVEIDQFDHSRCQLDLQMPTGAVERVNLSGSSTMAVYFEGTTEGSASDDDGDSLDEVRTEMTALNLDGYSPSLGPLRMILSSFLPTIGQMEETANNTPGVLDVPPFTPVGTIDSFFDVFLEIEMGGQTFHTIHPMRWSSVLTHKPPGPANIYENREDIELYDADGRPTGFFLGATTYQPNPIVEIDQFDHSRCQVNLMLPTGAVERVNLSGSSTMAVYFEGTTEGSALDDDGDGREEVQTEMTALDVDGSKRGSFFLLENEKQPAASIIIRHKKIIGLNFFPDPCSGALPFSFLNV